MDKLIEALTRAALAVAVYYEKQAHPLLPLGDTAVATAEQPAAEPRARRGRKPKEDVAAATTIEEAAAPAPILPPTDGISSEDESIKEVRTIAKLYVQRFANQQDGIAAFRKLMADICKVGKLDDLVHAQRLQIIAAAKAYIAKADQGTARPLAGAGVEV